MMESSIKKSQDELNQAYKKINDIIDDFCYSYENNSDDLNKIAAFQQQIIYILRTNDIFLNRMKTVFSLEDLLLEYFNCTDNIFLISDMQNKFEAAKKESNAEFKIMPRLHTFYPFMEGKLLNRNFIKFNNMPYEDIKNLSPENNKELYDIACFEYYCGIPNMLFFYQYYTNGSFSLYDKRHNKVYFLKKDFENQNEIKYENLGIKPSNRNYKKLEIAITPSDLNAAIQNAQISKELKNTINSCINSATNVLTLKPVPKFLESDFGEDRLPYYISTKDEITREHLIKIHMALQQSLKKLEKIYGPNNDENQLICITKSVATEFEGFILNYIEIANSQAVINNYISSNEFTIPLDNENSSEILKYTSVKTLKSICHFYNSLETADEKNSYVKYLDDILNIPVTIDRYPFEKYFKMRSSFSHIAVTLLENFSLANLYLKNETLPRDPDTILGLCKYTYLFPNETIDLEKLDYYKCKAAFLHNFLSNNNISDLDFPSLYQNYKSELDKCINYFFKMQYVDFKFTGIYTTIYEEIENANSEKNIKIMMAKSLLNNSLFHAKYKFIVDKETESTTKLISDVILSTLANFDDKNYRPNLINHLPQLSDKALEFISLIETADIAENLLCEIISNETKLNIFNLICDNENTLSMLTYNSLIQILSLPLTSASNTLNEINESPEILSELNSYYAPRDESSTFINKPDLIARSQETENSAMSQVNDIELEQ